MLLLAAFSIPENSIERNIESSVGVFEKEGTYPKLNAIGADSQLDNYTDALMLLSASYSGDESLVDRTINVYHPYSEKGHPDKVLISYYGAHDTQDVEYITYARYWHGYLVILKPLLTLLTYSGIRIFNAIVVFALAALLVITMSRKNLKRYILPYLLALALIDPIAISQSMQFVTVYCIYSGASVVLLVKSRWFQARFERIILFFVLIGCATSYFDLLTWPLATFGIPATIYFLSSKFNLKQAIVVLLIVLCAWFVGYIGMWAGKWIVGMLLCNRDVLMSAADAIATRSSATDSHGDSVSIFEMLGRQLGRLVVPALGFAVAYVVIAGVRSVWLCIKGKSFNFECIVYIGLCLLPFIWFLGACNHSYIHYWFTYRELLTTLFAGFCFLIQMRPKNMSVFNESKTTSSVVHKRRSHPK